MSFESSTAGLALSIGIIHQTDVQEREGGMSLLDHILNRRHEKIDFHYHTLYPLRGLVAFIL